MNRKIIVFILALCLLSFGGIGVFAEEITGRLIDAPAADLLTDKQESDITAMLDDVSKKHKTEFMAVALSTEGLEDLEPYEVAETYRQSGEYDDMLIMLILIGEEDRECWIFPYGETANAAFTDAGIDYMLDKITADFAEDRFARGIESYAQLCGDYMISYENGEPYDSGNLPKEGFKFASNIIIALVVGVVVAFISVSVMKGQLKTVRSKYQADDYLKQGSLAVTKSKDYFLYRTVSRVAKPKDNSSSGSSKSLSSGGGRGRKF